MKRSKMVEILRSAFLEHMHCSADCCDTDEKMYSAILKELEDSGMSPPDWEGIVYCMIDDELIVPPRWQPEED